MKKINVISVEFSEKTGIQDLYETIEECKATGRMSHTIPFINDEDCVGVVFGANKDFIEVYSNYDKFEILD